MVILYARYGYNNNFLDATAKVQAQVKGSALSLTPDDNLVPMDPGPGKSKSFVVVYQIDGRIYLSTSQQNSPLVLAKGSAR
jgi:hypothetical protein